MSVATHTLDPDTLPVAVRPAFESVLRRNPGEPEFHQAVHEVLASIVPVLGEHPHYLEDGILERLVEPERMIVFRVSWVERHYENSQLSTTERWTAILTIVIQTPRDAERLRANPLGIYVNAISWSREMSQ